MPLLQWTIEGRCNTTDPELEASIKKVFQAAAVQIQASLLLINPTGNVKVVCFGHDFFNPAEEVSAMAAAAATEGIDVDASKGTISQDLLDAISAMNKTGE